MHSENKLPLVIALVLGLAVIGGFVLFSKRSAKTTPPSAAGPDAFVRLMQSGKNYLDKDEADKALAVYTQALAVDPQNGELHLNLANSYLLAGQASNALKHAEIVLQQDNNSAAAHFVKGCAHLRLGQPESAVKALQQSKDLDPSVSAASFQLGIAQMQLKNWDAAIAELQFVVDMEPDHPAAHYNLAQALIRAGRQEEAAPILEKHQQILSKAPPGPPPGPHTYEKSKHTLARVPFQLEQPAATGIKVAFTDQTKTAFPQAAAFQGPLGVLDINHRGKNDLFLLEKGIGFRLLLNTNGAFLPIGEPLPVVEGAQYHRILVGDLQNDRFEDVIALGNKGSHVYKFATNGSIMEVSPFTRLQGLAALDGALVDLDFTGKLDLLAVSASNDLRVFRNHGNLLFSDITATSGVPAQVTKARHVTIEDWNNDDIMDVFVGREGEPPLLLVKQRGGPLATTNHPAAWPAGSKLAAGDLNNDLRVDFVSFSNGQLQCGFTPLQASGQPQTVPIGKVTGELNGIRLIDYDNDGWLDVLGYGSTIGLWRNAGKAGFQDQTAAAGLSALSGDAITDIAAADFDQDCDTDLILARASGLQFLRNDGGDANNQLQVRLAGNRSNASGLGIRIELTSGGLRLMRTVQSLPVELGVGQNDRLESLTVRWFDLALNSVDVTVDCRTNLLLWELQLPTGSCPYLYAWDGQRFRFVTDLLGAAPLGLRFTEHRFIEADTDEFAWIGNETNFKPKDGCYTLQITEELREVLYLDEAKLVVVDHPPGTEVHPTDKLLPGKPFPPGGIVTVHNRKPLLQATDQAGRDVTALLQEVDAKRVSPEKIRLPQLRGLAEPHSLTLEFAALDSTRPLMLVMTGWLRFGGGMANVAASHHPDLPFPFPQLEAKTPHGQWRPVDVVVGAPAGKTKSIVVDLAGKLPPGVQQLRLTAAFEIHWDRIALFEKLPDSATRVTCLPASRADLHWRGFSDYLALTWDHPLTPDYDNVRPQPPWTITPYGWHTRYGPVDPLIARTDDALALLNGGDELTLQFSTAALPVKPPHAERDFFILTVGWDKDADFHVAEGSRLEPFPFHGMDHQRYGREPRPATLQNDWIAKYNTRWIGPLTLKRPSQNPRE